MTSHPARPRATLVGALLIGTTTALGSAAAQAPQGQPRLAVL